MSSDNPFQAPKESIAPARADFNPDEWMGLTIREIRRLRNASHSIRSLGVLWALGSCGYGIALATQPLAPMFHPLLLFFGVLAILGGWATYGAWIRPRWGRSVGSIMCCLNLFVFPLGTMLGILGIIAFAQGSRLFGPDRITHAAIDDLFTRLKRSGFR